MDWRRKLASRKFWLTVGGVLAAAVGWGAGELQASEAVWAIVAAVAAYVGVEGFGDGMERFHYPVQDKRPVSGGKDLSS